MINNRNGYGVNIKRIMPGDFIHPVGPVLTGEAWLPVEEKIKGRVFCRDIEGRRVTIFFEHIKAWKRERKVRKK